MERRFLSRLGQDDGVSEFLDILTIGRKAWYVIMASSMITCRAERVLIEQNIIGYGGDTVD